MCNQPHGLQLAEVGQPAGAEGKDHSRGRASGRIKAGWVLPLFLGGGVVWGCVEFPSEGENCCKTWVPVAALL